MMIPGVVLDSAILMADVLPIRCLLKGFPKAEEERGKLDT